MPTLGSSISREFSFKKESAWGVAAGTGSAQIARRVTLNLNSEKDQYSSNEQRSDQQRVKGQFGGSRATGTLDGELSCGTYQAFFEANLRAAAAAVVTLTGLTVTVAGAGPTYTFTRGSGSYITDGIRVGMVVRPTAGLAAGILNRGFYVTALTALILTGYPIDGGAVIAEGPTAAVSVAMPGKRITFPSSGHTEDSFTTQDKIPLASTMYRHGLGLELNTIAVDLQPNADAKVSYGFLGKSLTTDTTSYFVSPTAATTTPVLSGPNGVLLVGGTVIAIATALTFNTNGNLSTQPVIGTTAVPAVFQGRYEGAGQLTAFLQDSTFFSYFDNGTEFEIAMVLMESTAAGANFMCFHLPACIAKGATLDDNRELKVTVPFDFNKKDVTSGYESTTISVQDAVFA